MIVNYQLELWMEIGISILVLMGGFVTLIGAIGLIRYKDVFERVHSPAMLCVLANLCFVLASVWFFSITEGRIILNTFLIAILLSLTNPITTIFIMRTALFRKRLVDGVKAKRSSQT